MNDAIRIIEKWSNIWDWTNIWNYSHIRKWAVIWTNCNIWNNVYIDSEVMIWNNTKIQNSVNIYKWVEISEDCFIWPSVTFTNDLFPRAFIWSDSKVTNTIIEKWVSIWANATIKCGITIGEYAMIWAWTMVTKNIEPYSLVVWNPWRVIWKVNKEWVKIN
jgi:acetyltransferase-like isoleucine patch superfamily enzyme